MYLNDGKMYKFTFYFGCWAGVGVDYSGACSGGDCGNGVVLEAAEVVVGKC